MIEDKNKEIDHKKIIGTLMLLSIVIGLLVGVVLGIELYQITTTKLGFWEEKVEATHLTIFSLRHQIQSSDTIRTRIQMGNTGGQSIFCNCTLYYKSALSEHLAKYSFNATVNEGEIHTEAFIVTPINVSQWTGTDVSIFEH